MITLSKISSFKANNVNGESGAKLLIPKFKDFNRIVGYKYDPKSVKEYKPKKIDLTKSEATTIATVFKYIHLGSMLGMYRFNDIEEKKQLFGPLFDKTPEILETESKSANKEDNLCFYCSSLMYLLLREEVSIDKTQLKYVQGFIRTRTSENYVLPDGNKPSHMFTCHAFVVYKGMIIDTTIMQIEKYLNYELEKPYVLGIDGYLPDVFSHFGFDEYPQTAIKFATRYATLNKMSFNDWLLKHRALSKKF